MMKQKALSLLLMQQGTLVPGFLFERTGQLTMGQGLEVMY